MNAVRQHSELDCAHALSSARVCPGERATPNDEVSTPEGCVAHWVQRSI